MEYTLYHKNLPTITFNMDEKGYPDKIISIQNEKHINPFFLENYKVNKTSDCYNLLDKLSRFMLDRNIPASRQNLSSALSSLGVKTTNELSKRSFYLSLSDQYWIAPTELRLNWEKINFFDNSFSEDVGKALFGNYVLSNNPNYHSPDSSTDGMLPKKWNIIDKDRILMKGGSGTEQLEPFNEVLASEIYQRLGIEHCQYSLYIHNQKHYSICKNMVNKNTEMITVADLCRDIMKWPDDNLTYDDMKSRCSQAEIDYDEIYFGEMFIVDSIINNEDRHLNNLGFMRDANTLEWIGGIPVFDNGSSMFYKKSSYELEDTESLGLINSGESKPFKKNHLEQIKLFPLDKIFRKMDLTLLNGIGDFYRELLEKVQRDVSEKKKDYLSEILGKRVENMKEISKEYCKEIPNRSFKHFRTQDDGWER